MNITPGFAAREFPRGLRLCENKMAAMPPKITRSEIPPAAQAKFPCEESLSLVMLFFHNMSNIRICPFSHSACRSLKEMISVD